MRKYIWALIGIAIALFLIAFSFCGPVYEIGQKCEKAHAICSHYHLVPRVFIWIIQTTDSYEGFFAFLTGVAVAAFTLGLVILGMKADGHFRVTERAYVRMSHVSKNRNGLQWSAEPDSGEFTVLVEAKNCGRTPARVTAIWLSRFVVAEGKEFPIDFSYGDDALSYDSGEGYSFIMPTDAVYLGQKGRISEASRGAVEEGSATLIVFGYVDYIDQFGVRHRAGYGRQYLPGTRGNNLGFPRVRAKLNYDEIRRPGVGWDWPKD